MPSKQKPDINLDCSSPLIEQFTDFTLAILSIFWSNVDNSVSQLVQTTDDHLFPKSSISWRALSFIFYLSLALIMLPVTVFTFPVWLVLNNYRSSPFKITRYETPTNIGLSKNASENIETNTSLTIISGNLCLLTEIAAKVNNLSHNNVRAKMISDKLLDDQVQNISKFDINNNNRNNSENDPSSSNSCDFTNTFPASDFLLFQEVFEKKSTRTLVKHLNSVYPYIVHSVGYRVGRKFKKLIFSFENSGLFFASKYPIRFVKFLPFIEAKYSDKLAEKGVLVVSVEISPTKSILLLNTHLQSTEETKAQNIRRREMKFLHETVLKYKNSNETGKDCVGVVLCGDLNFGLDTHDVEAQSFNEEFCDFQDSHQDSKFATCLNHKTMHEIKTADELKNVLETNEQKYLLEIDAKSCKLDHIWYSGSGIKLLSSGYCTGLVGLTDHVPITAKFKIA